jgi:hypothetical protein
MSTTTIYVVGPLAALKTNQWYAMTNDIKEVERLILEVDDCETYKTVEVKPSYAKSRRRNIR